MTRKPFRASGLRQSINVEEAAEDDKPAPPPPARADADEDEDTGNVVRRAGLTKKKRKPASRLSFGVRAEEDDAGADAAAPDVVLTPKKREGSGLKKSISLKDLTVRSRAEEEDRPRYSKEYLDELQSSTPNTPVPARPDIPEVADEMDLDVSELDGAVIVEDPSSVPAAQPVPAPRILTAVEIQEKKERRARLAHEQDFISFSDDDETVKKKDEPRLVREDENIFEGFEDFVDDEVALGRKAEREARRKKRKEMESMIREAEGNTDDESDESDAERRVAFEAAQSRAGMDGLKRPIQKPGEAPPKPRITPLPSMTDCLRALQETLAGKKAELEARSRKVAELRAEREEIRGREAEVQRLVDEAGETYRVAAAAAGGAGALEGGSPAQMVGESVEFAGERGLESFGTPTARRGLDDEGDLMV
ncbi:hypothetical protein IMZ48_02050 [Candidatus Bathyarchaeota archaeon]|nr:hypothetical protein [Candidatus Bathyarchaeota archaeon]